MYSSCLPLDAQPKVIITWKGATKLKGRDSCFPFQQLLPFHSMSDHLPVRMHSNLIVLTLKPYLGSLKTPEDQNASYFFNRLDVFAVNVPIMERWELLG